MINKLKYFLIKNLCQSKSNGEKRLFLMFGIFNLFISNLILQILLLLIPTFFATVISQIVNLILGFFVYGKKVFRFNNLNKLVLEKYIILASFLWLLNFCTIQSFFYIGVNKNLTAISIIPFLVLISYLSQKYFVFR